MEHVWVEWNGRPGTCQSCDKPMSLYIHRLLPDPIFFSRSIAVSGQVTKHAWATQTQSWMTEMQTYGYDRWNLFYLFSRVIGKIFQFFQIFFPVIPFSVRRSWPRLCAMIRDLGLKTLEKLVKYNFKTKAARWISPWPPLSQGSIFP